jgi:uncharacterized protein DUF6665
MTSRPPQGSSRPAHVIALDYEIAQEQASALGRLGRSLEAALAALSGHEAKLPERDSERARLVQDASDALWLFMVQREACGFRDPYYASTASPPKCMRAWESSAGADRLAAAPCPLSLH